MSEGTEKENAENQVNTRVSGDKVDDNGFFHCNLLDFLLGNIELF